MRLIKPSVTIESEIDGDKILKLIEKAGRTCYKSEDKITKDSAKKFIQGIIKRGHFSVLEHPSITARLICDRGVMAELTRHRLASFSIESTRYVNYDKKGLHFILPPWITDIPIGEYETCNIRVNGVYIIDKYPKEYEERLTLLPPVEDANIDWLYSLLEAERNYKKQIEKGRTPEQARSLLPSATKTEIVMTANLRELRHIFELRTSQAAHPQIREIISLLLSDIRGKVPIVFDDIEEGK